MSDVEASQDDWVAILSGAIDAGAAIATVSEAQAGGIAVFLGTTRAEKSSAGKELIALDYEAYEAMALDQMLQLAAEARQRWPIRKLVLLHRVGRVDVGQPSVLIAVATPHRSQAFDACRFLIDMLKSQATIWKKEIWTDGSQSWVHPQEKPKA
ncbi:MAG: molybdenum cofactor biosynthesis protein MoaE [Planctomycetota bacterium]|nr:molybdenum cofactor biosynthesis protein MoaE [Planctomycetota bacterium]